MMTGQGVAVFGGTFDPVHNGHLRSAEAVQALPGVDRVKLVPCRQPPHRRSPQASATDRLAMLHLATADLVKVEVDRRELERTGPSYTYDTLDAIRQEMPDDSSLLCVMGQDAYLTLPEWFRWRELCDLAHLLVLQRQGASPIESPRLAAWAKDKHQDDPGILSRQPAGTIICMQLVQIPVSGTAVRAAYGKGSPPTGMLPPQIHRYIIERGLYLPL